MKLSHQTAKVILFIQTGFIILLSILLFQSKNSSNNRQTASPLNAIPVQLKKEYFDDLMPVWLNGDVIKTADSQYAARTAPQPVIHPLDLTAINEPITSVEEFASSKKQAIISSATADVDSDGQKERIVEVAAIGGNHPPHEGYVIKNNTIILTFTLNSGSIEAAKDGNGFYVTHQLYGDNGLCCATGKRIYRVIYEGNTFKPAWEQDVTYITPAANSEDSNDKQ